MHLLTVLVSVVGMGIPSGAGSEPLAGVRQEISHLIQYVGDSGCEFKRNGVWSDAKTAAAHVRSKYDLLLKLALIDTAQDFIDKAATRSSLSGQLYQVKCGGDVPIPSSRWLASELARYQARPSR